MSGKRFIVVMICFFLQGFQSGTHYPLMRDIIRSGFLKSGVAVVFRCDIRYLRRKIKRTG